MTITADGVMSGNIYNVAIRRIISAGGKETLAEIDFFYA